MGGLSSAHPYPPWCFSRLTNLGWEFGWKGKCVHQKCVHYLGIFDIIWYWFTILGQYMLMCKKRKPPTINQRLSTEKDGVGPQGFEPRTNGLWVRCSNHWAKGPETGNKLKFILDKTTVKLHNLTENKSEYCRLHFRCIVESDHVFVKK